MRIIAVVMGEPDSKTRSKEVSEMLDFSFAQYKIEDLLKNKQSIGKYEIEKGKEKYASIVPKEKATVLRKKGEKTGNATYEIKLTNLKAPIKKGEIVGKMKIKEKGETIRTINLTTKKAIKKATVMQLYFRNIKDILSADITI